ncbi:MAG: DUF2165 family protein [Runella sp.]
MNRLLKIALTASIAVYLFLVIFNNLFDYSSNYQYISHIASMSEVPASNAHSWRSIQSPVVHHFLYIVIILWEITVFGLVVFGAYQMLKQYRALAAAFQNAKKYALLGLGLGTMLWFLVFVAIGGEWFLMWQSKSWSSQNVGFLLTITFLLFGQYLHREE